MWCSPVPAPSTDTRADPASARRAAEAARGRVGRAGGPLWCGPNLGAWGLFLPELPSVLSPRSAARWQLLTFLLANTTSCYCAPPTRLLTRRVPPKGRASPRRQGLAERLAAPSASVERASWAPDQSPVSYVPAGRPALAPDRHVQPRRRHGRSLRLQRRRRDGEDAVTLEHPKVERALQAESGKRAACGSQE